MQHPRCQSGQAAQRRNIVEVSRQRRDAVQAQLPVPRLRRRQRQQPHMFRQQGGGPEPDIATTNNQHTLASKARGQRTKRI